MYEKEETSTGKLFIITQNNLMRTYCDKAKIDYTRENSKCRHETINLLITKYCKLAQNKYKTKDDWVGEVMHEELCKRLKFDHGEKNIYAPTIICGRKGDIQNSLGLGDTEIRHSV